jgi:hypothetical protein
MKADDKSPRAAIIASKEMGPPAAHAPTLALFMVAFSKSRRQHCNRSENGYRRREEGYLFRQLRS